MAHKLSARITNGIRGISTTFAQSRVPSFEEVQNMSVKQLLSVPGIERLVSIKLVDFYARFANAESILDLVTALTMIPLRMDGDSVEIDISAINPSKISEDVIEARNALLIIKSSEKIIKKGTRDSFFTALISPESILLDAVFLVLDHITEAVMAADCLKSRSTVIESYIDSIDAIMLLLEFLASVPAGFKALMDKTVARYSFGNDDGTESLGRANPFFYLLDISYVYTLTISLLAKSPLSTESAAGSVSTFLEATRFTDHCLYHVLSGELSALLCHGFAEKSGSFCTLPATFPDMCTSLSKGTVMCEQEMRALQKRVAEYSFSCADPSTAVNEDVMRHAMELLCHMLASGSITLVAHIVQYLPLAAEALFSLPLSCALSLHRLKLLHTFASTCVSMILRIPRLHMHAVACNMGTPAQADGVSSMIPLHTIIHQLGEPAFSAKAVIDSSLLPPEVNETFIPVYNAYIALLTHFVQDEMPKAVSCRTDALYLARVAIIMRHIAGVFYILNELGKILAAVTNIEQDGRTYGEVSSSMQEVMHDYLYCGLIPETGTIISTCPKEVRLSESYLVGGRVLFPSPLSIFASMFPPAASGKNPLLTLQLMLFNLKTGGKTVIKHYAARILISVITFVADSPEMFKQVIASIKLSAFLPSVTKKANRNPFCNLICESLLRTCMKYDDIRWETYRESIAGFHDNSFEDLGTAYPLSLSGHLMPSSVPTESTDQPSLLGILAAYPGIVAYVQDVLEKEHNRYIRIRDRLQEQA